MAQTIVKALHAVFAVSMSFIVVQAEASQIPSNVERGRDLAATFCGQCHSIQGAGSSPLPAAPPLRGLHKRYPVENLEEALVEGIVTGHANMPEFELEPAQIDSLIAFLKSFE